MSSAADSRPKDDADEKAWILYLRRCIFDHPKDSLPIAEQVSKRFLQSIDARLLLAQAALHARKPAITHRMIKRIRRKVMEEPVFTTLEALAFALEGKEVRGRARLEKTGYRIHDYDFAKELPVRSEECVNDLLSTCYGLIQARQGRPTSSGRRATTRRSSARPRATQASSRRTATATESTPPPSAATERFQLPLLTPRLNMQVKLPSSESLIPFDAPTPHPDPHEVEFFRLRSEHSELILFEGFDELLCLPTLRGVEKYWYQVETARKVLKHFKGRVLLADEVGLGKTVEAGIILKEYILRGMAQRVLIVTPAALVGQWQEEMQTKLDLEFSTTRDPLLKRDPEAFWGSARIVASIATARRKEHLERLVAGEPWDLVIVDEAHHLKNRSSKNYALVERLQKRFLLLLSATPVQNSLVELYNLLTLLKPGIFKTERDFRAAYMTKGKPRTPQNRHKLRTLMRDVMIRNTRALVDVRLPPRQALTLRPQPEAEEARCYEALCELVHRGAPQAKPGGRLAYKHLLSAAGSSPRATEAALRRMVERGRLSELQDVEALADRYAALGDGCKIRALMELLDKNQGEKVIVFSQHKVALEHLAAGLREREIPLSLFHGGLDGGQKDAAIEAFRNPEGSRILLSTEAGGEGRNLQFCNTLVNFDLPWNPMAIEQRIGRLHRIGQTREVFVFNIAARGTVEDALLAILDDKLNMFELVVGEIGAILGEMDGDGDFADTVYSSWVGAAAGDRHASLTGLGTQMMAARGRYEGIKQFDEELFGDELEVAG